MNFSISKKILLEALNNISSGLATKTPSPTLTGIFLNVDNEKITLITSNREISIRQIINKSSEVEIISTGSVLIPGSYFIEIIRKIEDTMVSVSLFDDTTIKISTERSQFSLNSLDKDSYPGYNFDEQGEVLELSAKQLKKIVRQTAFASSTTKDNLALMGINFELEKDNLRVVATDSFRLSEYKSNTNTNFTQKTVNIQATSLVEFTKILSQDDEIVKITVLNNKVILKYLNTSFISRIIEGSFPKSSSLFEKDHLFEVSFTKSTLISAIERINLFSLDDYKLIKMIFDKDSKIKISSISNEIGKGEEELIPIDISEQIPFTVSFSSKYMLEALKAIDGNEVKIQFAGEIKPFILYSEQDENLKELILAARVF